ncbi:MAG: hypothetical protein SNJ67_06990 [Chloracidobacterium sp.]|uniref:FeoB-associated Cys-rich membrane protein n=1 Tax=Chloracidobacterium validum TaxID=2821543 RepID=A0ABX8BG22_9BACT|nr:hypothetical protein [Chloracidobacterium validum]QUW04460.1 hypothetical protein J8C06_11735 [Chloracidobacterium validum]
MQSSIALTVVGLAASFLLRQWWRAARRFVTPAIGCHGACGCARPGQTAPGSKPGVEPVRLG